MHIQLAASLFVGCAVRAGADAPIAAALKGDAAAFPSRSEDVAAPYSPAKGKKKGHRLLQQMKDRRAQHAKRTKYDRRGPDLGVLSSKKKRHLQEDYDFYCPRDTCPAELCDCADAGGSLMDCVSELRYVCRSGLLGDCVFMDYVGLYEDVYCPFLECVDGGSLDHECDCAFYELYCNRLNSKDCEDALSNLHAQHEQSGDELEPRVLSGHPDKKPFFG